MNRAAVLGKCPNGAEWRGLSEGAKRIHARAVIRNALQDIADGGEQPDPWEGTMLASAIGVLSSGFYTLSVGYVEKAMASVNVRSQNERLELFTLDMLLTAFTEAEVRTAPLR